MISATSISGEWKGGGEGEGEGGGGGGCLLRQLAGDRRRRPLCYDGGD